MVNVNLTETIRRNPCDNHAHFHDELPLIYAVFDHPSPCGKEYCLLPPPALVNVSGMNRYTRPPLTAVLGPTNTGKTHLAVERMLGHSSGMIGFPLRLLAREIYDRVVAMRGPQSVALVTGEERIWPQFARYLLCTTEAMPITAQVNSKSGDGPQDVAFVALDEAQLGQDRERGHVFTSRMLHARGREETMILGAASLTPVVRHLLPEAEIVTRPRFSTLLYDGPRKLSRLPPRSVIVAFSAEEVYTIAEALRRFSGGAAVVMGALSPATRNAQVAMFQAGEVDYLVATDAIGMGLNLDVSHVAFASLNKFDGVRQRRLTVAEMAQIAGRAGRHQRDGTFGSIGAEAAFTPEEIAAIEGHHFPRLDWLHWRNPMPSLDNVADLIADLEAPPPDVMLRAAPESTDLAVLRRMSEDGDAMALVDGADAGGNASVRRLWNACSLPDFRKSGPEGHGRTVARIWRDLATGSGHIDADWFTGQLRALDNQEGAVEVLADRISAVRTYCYIAQRPDWLAEPEAMAQQASQIEQRLSDAMHEALVARFVDRRTTVLMRALGQDATSLPVTVAEDGAVRVDGEAIGHLDGFAFRVDPATRADDQRLLLAAAERHLAVERASRATALAAAPDDELVLVLEEGEAPALQWHGHEVATLVRGKNRLAPRIALNRSLDTLEKPLAAAVIARLDACVDSGVSTHLRPLIVMAAGARDPDTGPVIRAILAAMVDGSGTVARDDVDLSLRACSADQRQYLWSLGVRVGTLDLFCPALVKPGALNWLAALEAAWHSKGIVPPPTPGIGIVAVAEAEHMCAGFRKVGDWWLRVDLAERVSKHSHGARKAAMLAAEKAAKRAAKAPPAALAATLPASSVKTDGAVAVPVAESPPPASPPASPSPGSDRPAPVFPSSISAPSAVMGATAPDLGPAPAGGFHVSPDLANSIGLPLKDRLILMRELGFVTQTPPGQITIATEPHIWWTWRNRKSAHGSPHQKFRDSRRARAQNGGARARSGGTPAQNTGARPPPRVGRAEPFGAQPRGGKSGGGVANPGQGGAQNAGQRSAPPPAHSPFAALAGLFDGPAKPAKPRKKAKDAPADAPGQAPVTLAAIPPAGDEE